MSDKKFKEWAEHMLGIKISPRLKKKGVMLAADKLGIGRNEEDDI